MKKIQISPSILSANFGRLGDEIRRLEEMRDAGGLNKTKLKKVNSDLKRLLLVKEGYEIIDRMWEATLDIADIGSHKAFDLTADKDGLLKIDGIKLTESLSTNSLGFRFELIAAFSTFCPCSSVPVKKNTLFPNNLLYLAIISQAILV